MSGSTSRVGLFRGICRRISERAAGRSLVVGVDDVHLLDDGTAALVLHPVTSHLAQVVVTVRSAQQCADAVVALWKEGHVVRVDLAPLSATETAEMDEAHLGAPLDRDARRWIGSTSDGSPLDVRELVSGAVQLALRWPGPAPAGSLGAPSCGPRRGRA